MIVLVISEREQILCSFNDDAAAVASIAAVGATLGDEFFTAKADTTVSSIACFNMNLYEIYKFQLSHLLPYTTMK